jgi:hypothetical protein
LNKTNELEKSMTAQIKKDMNNTKQEKLENFSVDILKEINVQKVDFMKWMTAEQNRHTLILNDITKKIESKLKDLEKATHDMDAMSKHHIYTSLLPPKTTSTSYEPFHTRIKHEDNDHSCHYDKVFGQDNTTTPTIQDYNDKYIKFMDRGVEFTMCDHDFKKCPPLVKPLTNGDIMVIYNQKKRSSP